MRDFITRTIAIAAVLFTLAACGGGDGGKAVTLGESMPNPPIVDTDGDGVGDNADAFPTAAARSAATTTYGEICYSVQVRSKSMEGCRTQAWEDRELQALRYGEFVLPISETDLRYLYDAAWKENGLLEEEVYKKMNEILSLMLPEGVGEQPLGDEIERFLFTEHFRNLMDHGEFGDVQEVQYRAKFDADAIAASWEANAATVVFEPAAR